MQILDLLVLRKYAKLFHTSILFTFKMANMRWLSVAMAAVAAAQGPICVRNVSVSFDGTSVPMQVAVSGGASGLSASGNTVTLNYGPRGCELKQGIVKRLHRSWMRNDEFWICRHCAIVPWFFPAQHVSGIEADGQSPYLHCGSVLSWLRVQRRLVSDPHACLFSEQPAGSNPVQRLLLRRQLGLWSILPRDRHYGGEETLSLQSPPVVSPFLYLLPHFTDYTLARLTTCAGQQCRLASHPSQV
jgi:hypothetical protein